MSIRTKSSPKFTRAYERGLLRAAFVSLFWAVIMERKKRENFTFQSLAKMLGTNKGEVSRWFSGSPNWTINTIAAIAHALGLDLQITARERATGAIFTPAGLQEMQAPKRISERSNTLVTELPISPRIVKMPETFGIPNEAEAA
jgi:transcriptional regulator with XRE-family HTH domain